MFSTENAQQWGSQQAIPPADVPGAPGKLVRVVNVNGDFKESETATIVLAAIGKQQTTGPLAGITRPGGPLVAVATFGIAGGGAMIEFDVPNNFAGSPAQAFDVIQGGGSMVSFPCCDVNVEVRNDARYIPSPAIAGGIEIGATAGEPLVTPTVKGMVGVGPKTGRLTRSVWLLNTGGTAAPFSVQTPVPPFARTFRVLRRQSNAADSLIISPQAPSLQLIDSFSLVGTALSPDFVVGPASLIDVNFPAGAGTVSSIVLVFTLQMGGE